MPVYRKLIIIFLSTLWLYPVNVSAVTQDTTGANQQMKEWINWVLYKDKEFSCPAEHGNFSSKNCAWPSRLVMELDDEKGKFSQKWIIYKKTRITLPGSEKYWPQDVIANKKVIPVTRFDKSPAIWLEKGEYLVEGRFSWPRIPEELPIPPATGLISIKINGQVLPQVDVAEDGKVWLKRSGKDREKNVTDSLDIKVYRRVIDGIPMQVESVLQISVSGRSREVFLQPLLSDLIPLSLNSKLPARLENDGRLRLQVRPGHWEVRLMGRFPAKKDQLSLPGSDKTTEVWAFDAKSPFRVVEVQGVQSIDPRQTTIPSGWQQLPVYQVSSGQVMTLKEIRRGDPDPQPDNLNLKRQMWLDFDGEGYNFKDQIQGNITRDWRIEAGSGVMLGNVSIDGQPQFVTHLPGHSDRQGVELRRGHLNMEAESRYEQSRSQIPATGWNKDFSSVFVSLHIPPGYKVFSISGIDNDPATWIQQWTLLDLFIVLLISIAILRLWSWQMALLALITLAITWHQPGAPQGLWVAIVAGSALYKVISQDRYRRWITVYLVANFILLVLLVIPFAIKEIRVSIYPQLEYSWRNIQPLGLRENKAEQQPVMEQEAAPERLKKSLDYIGSKTISSAPAPVLAPRKAKAMLFEIDPDAKIQTGYGTPQWHWQEISLKWNGPVDKAQTVNIVYIPRWINRLLGFVRVISIIMLGFLLAKYTGLISSGLALVRRSKQAVTMLAIGMLVPVIMMYPGKQAVADTFPSPELLKELEKRLLEPPECKNACAEVSRMVLDIDHDQLVIRLEAHADARTAIPLPAHQKNWLPGSVTVDGKLSPPMLTKQGQLWAVIEPGVHQVLLSGKVAASLSQFQIPLLLKPHHGSARVKGWAIEGLHENGQLDSSVQFSRQSNREENGMQTMASSDFPALLRVERTLKLGLDWTVTTHVYRVNQTGSAVVVDVPLLNGESVTSSEVRVNKGNVQINLPAKQNHFSWDSTLVKSDQLKLTAAETTRFTEIWKIMVSPVWHIETEGIPMIHHVQKSGSWLPQWYPWPGETVSINVTRPLGVEGPTVTIDQSYRRIKPGQRVTDTQLQLKIRSSKGTRYPVRLPEGAVLQSVMIDNRAQPLREADGMVDIPLHPGEQLIDIRWREENSIRMFFAPSQVDLGIPSINHSTNIQLGNDRWVLWVNGPVMGPAVLFWGVVIVVAGLGFALGRIPVTPVRSWQWALLGIGLTQVNLVMAVIIVGWLLMLGVRGGLQRKLEGTKFNLMQLGLIAWSLLAMACLYMAIAQGLLGFPDMQVTGNNSYAYNLNWFQDRSEPGLPGMQVVSAPLLAYRLVMLAWALWLAFSLVRWIRWGWGCFSHQGLWQPRQPGKQESKPPQLEQE